MISTLNQYAQFLYCVYAGIIIGLLFDCLSILRLPYISFFNIALDILFWFFAFFIAFFIMLRSGTNTIRLYVLVGFAVGAFLYFVSLGKYIKKLIVFGKSNFIKLSNKLLQFLN